MILAIVQARLSSTRLPGKVMLPLHGEPMLIRQLERIARARKIDHVRVATSTERSDEAIAELCRARGFDCFRGSLVDVLDRFFRAALPFEPDYVVRLTADCPLADPAVIDAVIELCVAGGFDYASNTREPTFPDGLDVEVMKFACVREAHANAQLAFEREHVTPYVYRAGTPFTIGSLKRAPDLSGLRWTVDEKEDYELVRVIYDALYPANPAFTTEDVLGFIQAHPELATMNKRYARNEGASRNPARGEPSPAGAQRRP